MGQDYSYTQPSSSGDERSSNYDVFSSVEKRMARGGTYGFPQKCSCGLPAVTLTSTTDSNPGRVFFGCREHKDGRFHLFKWWDEALKEEMQDIRSALQNHDDSLRCLRNRGGQEVLTYPAGGGLSIVGIEMEVAVLRREVLEKLEKIEKRSGEPERTKMVVAVTMVSVVVALISFLFGYLV